MPLFIEEYLTGNLYLTDIEETIDRLVTVELETRIIQKVIYFPFSAERSSPSTVVKLDAGGWPKGTNKIASEIPR